MEKLIEFLRESNLLNRHRTITIEMFEDERDHNFFIDYIKKISETNFIIADLDNKTLDLKNTTSITFPQNFQLKIKYK